MKYNKTKYLKARHAGKKQAKQLVQVGICRGGGYGVSPKKIKELLVVLQGGGYNEPCAGGGYCKHVKLHGRKFQIVNGGGYKNAKPMDVRKYYKK